MSKFNRFQQQPHIKMVHESGKGIPFVDWKDIENLRRLMTPNGKIHGRKRLSATPREQTMIAPADKRARFMALRPYTSATL